MPRMFRLGGDVELAALTSAISARSRMRGDDNLHRVEHAGGAVVDTNSCGVAQSAEQRSLKPRVDGSIPSPAAPLRPVAAAAPPTRRGDGALMPLERDILAAILAFLHVHPRVAWAHRMNVGAVEHLNRDGTTRRVRFAFAGCPDVLGQLKDGRLLAIEAKKHDGRVTEDQVAFLSRAARHNAVAFVARSVDDVARMLSEPGRAA